MPWGYSSYRAPAPQRLTLEELLAQQQRFQPPPRPAEIQDLGGLDDAERRRVRQQSLFSGMASLGAAMSSGDWRHAGAGVDQVAAIQDQALAQANARRQQEWLDQQERQAAEYQQQAKQTQTAAVYGMYQRVIEGEKPDSPWVARAEAAARRGDMAELATMASPEVLGKRRAAFARGYDPDVWETSERLTADLANELEQRKRAALEAQELERQRKEAEIEREAKIAEEQALREQGLGSYAPPQLPPLSRLEAEEQIRAKYRARGEAAATQRIMEANGVPGLARLDPATNALSFTPATGIPEKPDRIQVFTNEDGVQAPYQLADDGNWYPMRVSQRPQQSAPPARPGAPPSPAPANTAPAANHWRNLAADALSRGGTEEEALRRLRAIGPQNGFSPEQILENAKALARKRGWKG